MRLRSHLCSHYGCHVARRSVRSVNERGRRRPLSLYQQLGGTPALEAALDRFYEKVLADSRIAPYFEGIDMADLKRKGQAFLAMAFGGPNEYQGEGLRSAHAGLRANGLDEADFDVFMGHFRSTLEELGVDEVRVAEVLAIANSGKEDVLGL